jgi:hypothetical protein
MRQRARRDVSDGGAGGAVLHLSHRAPVALLHRTRNPKPSSDPVCICRIGQSQSPGLSSIVGQLRRAHAFLCLKLRRPQTRQCQSPSSNTAMPIPILNVLKPRAAKAAGAPPAEEPPLGNSVLAFRALPCTARWHLLGPSCVRPLCRTGGQRLSVMFPPAPRGKSRNPSRSLTSRPGPATCTARAGLFKHYI